MIKIQESQINDIENVVFQNEKYYLVDAVAEFLKEDLFACIARRSIFLRSYNK